MKLRMYLDPNVVREDDPILATLEDYGFVHYDRTHFPHLALSDYAVVDADNPPTLDVESLDDLVRLHERTQMSMELDFANGSLTLIYFVRERGTH